jgi:hypothetical protein
MKIIKNSYYKIKLSTLWVSAEELSDILTKLTKKIKKEYTEVDLYNMLGAIEMEQLTTEFERGMIFYYFISTYDNLCISAQDTKEIYDESDAIEITIADLIENSKTK